MQLHSGAVLVVGYMQDYEYRKKLNASAKRSWSLTLSSLALGALSISGIFTAWHYSSHDFATACTIIVPGALFTIVCLIVAMNGRPSSVSKAFSTFLDLIILWP